MTGTKYVSIIATHQNRIRCLLSSIFDKKFDKFKNGAVLRLEMGPDIISCELVWEGQIAASESKPDTTYYITDDGMRHALGEDGRRHAQDFNEWPEGQDGAGMVIWDKAAKNRAEELAQMEADQMEAEMKQTAQEAAEEEVIRNSDYFKKLPKDNTSTWGLNPKILSTGKMKIQVFYPIIKRRTHPLKHDLNTYVFYLIRHGQGTHNTLSGIEKMTAQVNGERDTRLTEEGRYQALNTGRILGSETSAYAHEFSNARALFSSDLTRTIETLIYVINGFQEISTNKLEYVNKQPVIIVLPCAHELHYNDKGKCDGAWKPEAKENKHSEKILEEFKAAITGEIFQINWEYYKKFYGGGFRLRTGEKKSRNCKNVKFTELAIEIIQTLEDEQPKSIKGGKKRRTKKNKKLKRDTRSRKKKTRRRKRSRSHSRK